MHPQHETITLQHQELLSFAGKISSIYQYLINIYAVSMPNGTIEINYLFYDLYGYSSKLIKMLVPEQEKVNSLQHLWPIAGEWENEIFDLFGVIFDKNINRRIFTNELITGHLFKETFEHIAHINHSSFPVDNVLNIAPHYPKVQDAFKIKVQLQGEIIIDAQAQIGKNHWGFEKYCQTLSPASVNPLIERLDLDHAFSNSLLWSMCCEKIFNIEIDKRTKIIRMLFLELARIYGHLGYLLNILFESNYNDLFYQLLKVKKQLLNYYHTIYSNEGGLGICQIGRVNLNDDLPWAFMLENLLPWIEKKIVRIKIMLNRQNTWCSKMQTCFFSKNDILAWSLSGPIARSVGVNFDLRQQGFYYYPELNLKIPLGITGTALDIYLVRMEEMLASIEVIRQLLDNLPYGRKSFDGIEWRWTDFHAVEGEIFHQLEGADGQYGIYLKMGKNLTIQRLRLATPSFNNIFAFSNIIKGKTLEEVNPVLSSLNISPGELDR